MGVRKMRNWKKYIDSKCHSFGFRKNNLVFGKRMFRFRNIWSDPLIPPTNTSKTRTHTDHHPVKGQPSSSIPLTFHNISRALFMISVIGKSLLLFFHNWVNNLKGEKKNWKLHETRINIDRGSWLLLAFRHLVASRCLQHFLFSPISIFYPFLVEGLFWIRSLFPSSLVDSSHLFSEIKTWVFLNSQLSYLLIDFLRGICFRDLGFMLLPMLDLFDFSCLLVLTPSNASVLVHILCYCIVFKVFVVMRIRILKYFAD